MPVVGAHQVEDVAQEDEAYLPGSASARGVRDLGAEEIERLGVDVVGGRAVGDVSR
jgi:hypothetical protein